MPQGSSINPNFLAGDILKEKYAQENAWGLLSSVDLHPFNSKLAAEFAKEFFGAKDYNLIYNLRK
jgi:hypothetical protein